MSGLLAVADPRTLLPVEPRSSPGDDPIDLLAAARLAIDEGWTPAEAARQVLAAQWSDRRWPDDPVLRRLAEIGLAQLVNNNLGIARGQASRPAITAVRAPTTPAGVDVLDIPSQTADGSMKPLRAWAIVDWRAWERYCEAQADGWVRQQDGSRDIAALLEKHGAETIAALRPATADKARKIIQGFRA